MADSGPGIGASQRTTLFQPFATGVPAGGLQRSSGLGLGICHEIVVSPGGRIVLENRALHAQVLGLDATVRLPLTDNPP